MGMEMVVQSRQRKRKAGAFPAQTTVLEGGCRLYPILEMLRETGWLSEQREATLGFRPSSVRLSPQLEQD